MKLKNGLLLTLTAFIWGTAFVAQSVGMDYLTPFQFNGIRSYMGSLVLVPVILFMNRGRKEKTWQQASLKMTLLAGLCCGVILFTASSLQQFGVSMTTAGKAGFITATYIVIVPLLGLFIKKKVGVNVWIAEVFALAGLYLLCIKEDFSIGGGDVYVFLCAIVFSLHILAIDYFVQYVDGVLLSCMQFFVSAVLSTIAMGITDFPQIAYVRLAIVPLLYAGVLSCGVAYTLQIVGQKGMNPTIASLIMSLESTFSVIGGALILHEAMSLKEGLGCILMFVAIMMAQIPGDLVKKAFLKGETNGK